MEVNIPAGFREIAHTADWELQVWAPDLCGLLEQAARGMVALTGTRLQPAPRVSRRLEIPVDEAETLLVSFLSELLYLGEVEGLGFDDFDIQLQKNHLQVQLIGGPIASRTKEIKAVTYHNLAIRQTGHGLEAHLVFDV